MVNFGTSANVGRQFVDIRYNSPAAPEVFNRALADVIPKGIYNGGELIVNTGNYASINPGTFVFSTYQVEQPENRQMIRCETRDTVNVSVNADEYIVLRYQYAESSNWYADIGAVVTPSYNGHEVILGQAVFTGPDLTSFNTSERDVTSYGTGKVLISGDDTNQGYIEAKIVAGTNISINVLNPGANEELEISAVVPTEGAPTGATYLVNTAHASLTNAQDLSALSTGVMKVTTGTGEVSIASPGTDYYKPGDIDVYVSDGGTGRSTWPVGSAVVCNTLDVLSPVTSTANTTVLTNTAGLVTWESSTATEEVVGVGKEYWGFLLPDKYVWADGSSLLIADYPRLYAVFGTFYGSTNELDFKVPDKRARVSIGVNSANIDEGSVNQRSIYGIGYTGGEEYHILSGNEVPDNVTVVAEVPGTPTDVAGLTHVETANTAHINMQPYIACNYIIYAGE